MPEPTKPTGYTYTGPVSGATLKTPAQPAEGDKPGTEASERKIAWHPGKTYDDLPVNHPQIAALIARGLLVPIVAEEKPEAAKPQPKGTTTPTPKSEAK